MRLPNHKKHKILPSPPERGRGVGVMGHITLKAATQIGLARDSSRQNSG
jgi:hypothetical protein